MALMLIATSALAHGNSDATCTTAGQQPDVIAARAELERSPEVLSKRLHLGDLLVNAGCFDEAIHVLEAGESSNPRNSDLQYRLNRARSMVKEKEYFQGIDEAESAAKLRRGLLRCNQLGDIDACDNVLAIQPGNSDVLLAKGNALFKVNRIDEAIAAFSQAAQLAPSNVSITARLQAAQQERVALQKSCMADSGDAALQACRSILVKGAPNEFELTVRIAVLQQSSNQLAQALDSYIAADSLRPGDRSVALAILALLDSTRRADAVALAARGSSLMTLGRLAEAVVALRQALALSPDLPGVARQLLVAESQARQSTPSIVVRTAPAEKAIEKIAEAAPRRTSFSNVEPASRSN